MSEKQDVLIVGGGSSGGVLAVLLSELGFRVALVDARDPELPYEPDSRAFAIVRGGWRVLEAAGVADALLPDAQALQGMEAHDQNGVLPAAQSIFGVSDLPEDRPGEPLGYMIEVDKLNIAIRDRVAACAGISRFAPDKLLSLETGSTGAIAKLESGETIHAELVVGADGVGSMVREIAGIRTIGWSYDQAVVAATVQLSEPHYGHAR